MQFLKRLGIFFLEALVPILAFILMAFLCPASPTFKTCHSS